MKINKIRLRNYRNYQNLQLDLEHGVHFIIGKNAQGKTNLLEAIFYLSTTRSHRIQEDKELIREGEASFVIDSFIKKEDTSLEQRICVDEKGKHLFIYHTPVRKVSDFIGEFNAVMFCPDDMRLFHSSPKVRRKFMDMELSKMSKQYTSTLNSFYRLLKERNACLKQETINQDFLQVLTQQMIQYEIVIIKQRYQFLLNLMKYCKPFYEELSQDQTILSFDYMSCVPYKQEEVMMEELKKKYEKALPRDLMVKQTTVGIHKEDFMWLLNGKKVESFASQGQKRSILLSLKVGIVHMIHSVIKEYPVLLLDDVFSELDQFRRKKLLLFLPKEVQIFISSTELEEIPDLQDRAFYVWKVENGCISKQ